MTDEEIRAAAFNLAVRMGSVYPELSYNDIFLTAAYISDYIKLGRDSGDYQAVINMFSEDTNEISDQTGS